ncbi:MAG: SRPBCC family protein [Bacteroidales bacterium]
MKALKIILIIVGILVAAMLIIPLFLPPTTEVSAETEIELKPIQIYPAIASFEHREEWDPWVTMDTTAEVNIQPVPGYVGSTYMWEGEMLGTGRMEVDSVVENEYVMSSLWFGDVETPAVIEWTLEPTGDGTRVVWSYEERTTYPFNRLRMLIGKPFLKRSFETGLENLKTYLEENPPETRPA